MGFLLRNAYALTLAWVFIDQLGAPLPAAPVLVAAGALARTGKLQVIPVVIIGALASLLAHVAWYEAGKRGGRGILKSLCRLSLEPDSCVRRTEGIFSKQGARSLLLAKFIPGLSTVAPPLAGIFHMRARKFLLFDGLGSLVWGGSILGAGYIFSEQIERIAEHAARLGGSLAVLIIGGLAGYIAWKFLARQRFLRDLRIARISPEELKQEIDAGIELVIVDLRHSMDFEADPETIPGAFRMDAKELEEKTDRLPLDREVILYCT